jgi:hypothetical protein
MFVDRAGRVRRGGDVVAAKALELFEDAPVSVVAR